MAVYAANRAAPRATSAPCPGGARMVMLLQALLNFVYEELVLRARNFVTVAKLARDRPRVVELVHIERTAHAAYVDRDREEERTLVGTDKCRGRQSKY